MQFYPWNEEQQARPNGRGVGTCVVANAKSINGAEKINDVDPDEGQRK